MSEEINWDVCPQNWKKNFRCFLVNNGLWRLEEGRMGEKVWGKWIFCIEQIDKQAPTFADQRNFFTGLFEAEWKNDNFVFKDGSSKSGGSTREKKIEMFKKILDEISQRADIKDTPRGMDFYLKKYGGNPNEDRD